MLLLGLQFVREALMSMVLLQLCRCILACCILYALVLGATAPVVWADYEVRVCISLQVYALA